MVTAYREAVAIAAKQKDVQGRASQADAGGEGNSATMNEVGAVAVNKVGKPGGTPDAGEGKDLLVIELRFFENLVERGEDGEVTATGTPGGMIGGEVELVRPFRQL